MGRYTVLIVLLIFSIGIGDVYSTDKVNTNKLDETQSQPFKASCIQMITRKESSWVFDCRCSKVGIGISGESIVWIFRGAVPPQYIIDQLSFGPGAGTIMSPLVGPPIEGLKRDTAYVKKNKKWQFIRMIDSNISIDKASQLFGIEINRTGDKK